MPNDLNGNQGIQNSNTRRGQFAESFSLWEKRGRGWQIFDYEIELEPVFSRVALPRRVIKPIDDGRVSTFFSKLLSSKGNPKSLSNGGHLSVDESVKIHPSPRSSVETVSFRTHLPKELKNSSEQTEQMLLNLASSASFISFEIIGIQREIIFQITCPEQDKTVVLSQLKSHLPNIDFRKTKDALRENFRMGQTNKTIFVDFGLGKEWFMPLPFSRSFAADTLLPLVAVFEEITSDGEVACLQIMFSRARHDWQHAAQEAIFDRNGKLVFANFQNHLSGIKEKLSKPLLAVRIRFAATGDSREKSLQIARKTSAFFRQFSSPNGNELIPLKNDELDPSKHLQSFLSRTTYRGGVLLSASELSAIIHLPSDSVTSQKLCRDENRTRSAPEFATTGTVILGENRHAGLRQIIKLSNGQRLKHIWITGASGCGKSSLITNLAEQDFKSGNGGCILEPHGDLIESVIARIPENRVQDVILFDPADEDFPVGFNPLQANSELEKTLLSSDLTAIFQGFWSSQGDIISNVLHNSILAFLSSKAGGTLVDLKHFLVDRNFRNRFLETIEDEEIHFYWLKEFPPLAGRITPLLTRLNLFLRSKLIRNIIVQKNSKLDFRRIMDERKILLVKLTHGAIGEENARLLGSFIIAKLYQAALSRQNVEEANRPTFFVSVDEAHHFLVPSMALLLSGGRKYGIGLLASHQDTQQMTSRDADILSGLMTNCYTRICFRSDTDAEKLAKGFSFFTSEHLKNLGVGESLCRLEQSRYDFNLKTYPLESVQSDAAERRRNAIIKHSRKTYARPRAEVEEEIKNGRQISTAVGLTYPESNKTAQSVEPEMPAEKQSAEPLTSQNTNHENHGRGGRHHQELQAVIKRMAESYGFQVNIEQNVLSGAGSVDVSLERANLRIGCEVSVTSTIDYETKNILKCLAAGYDYAVVVVSNQKKIPALTAKLRSSIPLENLEKIKVLSLTGLLAFLRELTMPEEAAQKRGERKGWQRLTLLEASEFLGISPSALYRWAREGRIPFYRVGREYRFDRDELALIGRHDLSGKRKASVKLSPLKIEKTAPKSKKQQDERYRKLLKLE